MSSILSADVVFPVASAPILDGGVVIEDGVIRALGPRGEMEERFPLAVVEHFPRHILVPGLVNAHCHLELSDMRGVLPPGHFVEWVRALLTYNQERKQSDEETAKVVREGIGELLAAGVTAVGDISKNVAATRREVRAGPVRAVSFGEVMSMGSRRDRLGPALAAARERSAESATMRVGISPHAPYTVEGPALQSIVEAAREDGLPVCMHLAELAEEREFLSTLGGRIREAWDLGGTAHLILDDRVPRLEGGPIRWAQQYGLFSAGVPTVLAHVNYASDEDLSILSSYGASVAYCPRTRAFFGHDQVTPHRFREMLARGINVCLGTDSLASNPDLALMREAQFLLGQDARLSPALLLEMITSRGARALGLGEGAGVLEPGGRADVSAFKVGEGATGAAEGMLRDVLVRAPSATGVWIGGTKCV